MNIYAALILLHSEFSGFSMYTWPRCCPRRAFFLDQDRDRERPYTDLQRVLWCRTTQPPGFTEERYCFFVLRPLAVPQLSFSLDRWKNTRDLTLLYLHLRVTKPIQSDLRCERVESRLIRLTHQAKLTSSAADNSADCWKIIHTISDIKRVRELSIQSTDDRWKFDITTFPC